MKDTKSSNNCFNTDKLDLRPIKQASGKFAGSAGVICNKMKILLLLLFIHLAISSSYAENKNVIHGTKGDDNLIGGAANDEVHGGSGDDTLYGGGGSDLLYGGSGSDTFVVDLRDSSSIDTVMDFNPDEGDDVLFDFTGFLNGREKYKIPKKLDAHNVSLDYKGNIIVNFTNNKSTTVLNIKRADLNMDIEDKGKFVRLRFKKKF